MPLRVPALALLLLPLILLAPLVDANADEDKWRRKLDKNDVDELFQVIRQAAERKDPTAAIPLWETALTKRFSQVTLDNKPASFPHIAIACGEALKAIGWPGEEKAARRDAEKYLTKIAKTKDEHDQVVFARVIGAWGDPLADQFLAGLLSGRKPSRVQTEALIMAGGLKIEDPKDFPATRKGIEKALKSKNPEVRVAACSAAGRRKEKGLIEGLVALAKKDKESYPGLYAVWALKHIGYDQGIGPFLHVLSGQPKRETRNACLKAVTDLSSLKDVDDLLSLTKHSKQDYRDAAAIALGRLAWRGKFGGVAVTGEGAPDTVAKVPDKVIERMVTMVETESSWECRDAARQALIRFGESAAGKIKKRMPSSIDFSEEDTRLTSMELCGLFRATDAYKSLYKTSIYDKSRTIRMFAARALEGVNPTKAAEELAAVAGGAGKKVRDYELNAVRALGYIRTASSFDALVEMIDSESDNEEFLREVEYALERITGHRFGRKPEMWRKWHAKAKNPYHPMIGKYDRSMNRREALEKGLYGLRPETEKAVENGLRWLELQQHDIGFWDGNDKAFAGVVHCEPAYTGLSLLAYLGAGYNGREGKYYETIRRAAEFLAATQFYDGGFPVTGGGDDSWIYAYLIAMGVWGVTEGYALAGMDELGEPAQWGIDYLERVQTSGGGWRYGPRYHQSDTSCTSWVLMTVKSGDLVGLHISQRCLDGIDSWLERCSYDVTGKEEIIEDLSTDYEYEVGAARYFKAFTGYFELSGSEKSAAQMTSMTAVGMVCRFFMGWKRSHPYMIGSANYLEDYLPVWMKGLERGQAIAWYHYYWYYGTLAMHQMGGRYWRHWNDKIRRMYPEKQRRSPADLFGSWDPDTALSNGGRLFSTAMSILSLETYYRFSPLLGEVEVEEEAAGGGDGGDDE